VPRIVETVLFWLTGATTEQAPSGANGDTSIAAKAAAACSSCVSSACSVR
jgi:hypothetical protein